MRGADHPDKCKKLAKKYQEEFKNEFNSEKWNSSYKDEVMKKGLVFKYQQNKDLLDKLIETGDSILIENNPRDLYWAGVLENSINRLGNMLMELRDNFNQTGLIQLK